MSRMLLVGHAMEISRYRAETSNWNRGKSNEDWRIAQIAKPPHHDLADRIDPILDIELSFGTENIAIHAVR